MKRQLWIVPGILALPAWGYWVLFLRRTWGERPTEQAGTELWLTLYFVIALALSLTAAALHPRWSGTADERDAAIDEQLQEQAQTKP